MIAEFKLMIVRLTQFVVVIAALALGAELSLAETIPWAQVSPAAQTIAKPFFDTPGVVERKTEKNQVVFHIVGTKEGKDAEVDVTSNGKLLSSEQELALADVTPPTVQQQIKKLSQLYKLSGITRVFDGDELTFDVEFMKGKRELYYTLDATGAVLSTEETVKMDELPAVVQKAIRREVGNGKIHSIGKVIENGETTYDVEGKKYDEPLEFTVDPAGDLISMKVRYDDLPMAVQVSIREKVADATIEGITKSTEDEEVFYDVEAKRAGHLIVFSFGDDGLLSSEDEELSFGELPAALQKQIRAETSNGRIESIWRSTDEDGTAYEVELKQTGKTIRFVESNGVYSREN